jgi:argininosuccinate synthase
MNKVILAYSGGLDTSCCLRWLKDRGLDVVCFVADLGQGEDFGAIKKRALKTGASKVYVRDLRDEFIKDFVYPALKADAVYGGKYLLATALSRPLIAKYLVDIAHKEKAGYVAHGCTGKGNDQVRLEVAIGILDSKLKIIAPVREWQFKTRQQEIDYAKRHKIPITVTKKKPYSIDMNLWGVSIEGGVLEDPWREPPEDIYIWTENPRSAPNRPRYITIEFNKGIPVGLNGRRYPPKKLINKICDIASGNGIGRVDMIEDRLVGIKTREIYEAPAATVLHLAHRELESMVLDRETLRLKAQLSLRYAELVYYGLWYSNLKDSLDKFIESTQAKVTGIIKVRLHKGKATCVGRKSRYSLYKEELATYGKLDKFDQRLAEGFIKLWGLPHIG